MKTITPTLANVHALTGIPYDGDQPENRPIKRAKIGMPEDADPSDVINDHGTTWQDVANEYARNKED